MAQSIRSPTALTFTEWHAAVLGVAVGWVVAYVQHVGNTAIAVGLGGTFVVLALGMRRVQGSVTVRTVPREPWCALAGFVAAGALVLAVV